MKAFFDTNILVYIFDSDNPEKKKIAQGLLAQHVRNNSLVLSPQVLQEFFITVTRKLEIPMSISDAQKAVQGFAKFPVISANAALIIAAIERMKKEKFSFWDALIVEAALKADAAVLYSEDMQDKYKVKGLVIENPFT